MELHLHRAARVLTQHGSAATVSLGVHHQPQQDGHQDDVGGGGGEGGGGAKDALQPGELVLQGRLHCLPHGVAALLVGEARQGGVGNLLAGGAAHEGVRQAHGGRALPWGKHEDWAWARGQVCGGGRRGPAAAVAASALGSGAVSVHTLKVLREIAAAKIYSTGPKTNASGPPIMAPGAAKPCTRPGDVREQGQRRSKQGDAQAGHANS